MNYTQQLWRIMGKKPQPIPPMIIYGKKGYTFNGVNYGEDREAAYKARREYFLKLKSEQ